MIAANISEYFQNVRTCHDPDSDVSGVYFRAGIKLSRGWVASGDLHRTQGGKYSHDSVLTDAETDKKPVQGHLRKVLDFKPKSVWPQHSTIHFYLPLKLI